MGQYADEIIDKMTEIPAHVEAFAEKVYEKYNKTETSGALANLVHAIDADINNAHKMTDAQSIAVYMDHIADRLMDPAICAHDSLAILSVELKALSRQVVKL